MKLFEHENNMYMFIHIPKSAGTSIRRVLKDNFTSYVDLTQPHKNNTLEYDKKIGDHAPIFYIKPKLKNHELNFIAVVRNPWARMFSVFQHTMMRRKLEGESSSLLNNFNLDTRSKYTKSFETSCLEHIRKVGSDNIQEIFEFWLFFIGRDKEMIPNGNPNWNILPQDWWFLENDILSSKVHLYQFEEKSRLEEFLGIDLKHRNASRLSSNSFYKKFYNRRTEEYVYNLDRWVVEKFNYTFN